jgi:hypothetical protein
MLFLDAMLILGRVSNIFPRFSAKYLGDGRHYRQSRFLGFIDSFLVDQTKAYS